MKLHNSIFQNEDLLSSFITGFFIFQWASRKSRHPRKLKMQLISKLSKGSKNSRVPLENLRISSFQAWHCWVKEWTTVARVGVIYTRPIMASTEQITQLSTFYGLLLSCLCHRWLASGRMSWPILIIFV